jgi:hypothetical protein
MVFFLDSKSTVLKEVTLGLKRTFNCLSPSYKKISSNSATTSGARILLE